MRSHQQKFLADIELAAKQYGMEVVVDQQYGNTGWVTISFEDSYEPVARFSYNFQTGNNSDVGYATFEKGPVDPERVERRLNTDWANTPAKTAPDEEWTRNWHLKPDELPRLLKAVRKEMAEALNARRKEEFGDNWPS